MLILPQKATLQWTGPIQKHYIEKGYNYTGRFDSFEVDVLDLKETSHAMVRVICDYCGTEYEKEYRNHIKDNKKNILNNDCCKACSKIKNVESTLLKYGVTSVLLLPEVKEKIEKTNMEKYGASNVFASDEIKLRIKDYWMTNFGVESHNQLEEVKDKKVKTYLENWGVDHPHKNELIIEQCKQTNLLKYGCEIPSQNLEVQAKMQATNMERFGVPFTLQNKEVRNKMRKTNILRYGFEVPSQNPLIASKIRQTLYNNGTAPCSVQQRYLHDILGGELNYPFGSISLDIAFPSEKIYIEYNGGGHWLSVEIGNETIEKFNDRNRRRWYFLNSKGWKEITIVSKSDLLPAKEKVMEIFLFAKKYLETGHSWIRFNIDNESVEYNGMKDFYDFGEMIVTRGNRKFSRLYKEGVI